MPSLLDLITILLFFTTIATGQGTRRSPAQEIMYLKNMFGESAGIKGPDFDRGIGNHGYTRPIADKIINHQKGKARTESTTYRI